MPKTGFLILTSLVLTISSPLAAKSYRWVDENGVTVYSQKPPPSGSATEIKPPPPPAISPEEAQRKLDAQRQSLEDLREDRELKKKESGEKKAEAKRQKSNCKAAQKNLADLISRPHARQKGEDGEYSYVTEEARQKIIAEAKKHIKENCK
ncbi:DUF4124 domain-containing protein [Pseudomonadota bacterium]